MGEEEGSPEERESTVDDDAIQQDAEWQAYKRRQRMLIEARSLRTIYIGQNALIDRIGAALDLRFPPEDYGKGHGTGYEAPGDIVRQFKVDIDKTLVEVYGVDGTEKPDLLG